VLNKLTESIYYLPFESDLDRPILGYIKGTHTSLMVDAGSSPAHVEKFVDAVEKEGFLKPNYCALTHWHWDHTFGTVALGIPIIAHLLTNQKLLEMKEWQWDLSALEKRVEDGDEIEFCSTHMKKEYEDISSIRFKSADILFENRLVIDLGHKIVELLHVDSSHGEDSVLVYVPEDKVVFLGDVYTEDYYNDERIYKDKNRSLFQFLKELDFEIGIHGHAIPQTKQEILAILEEMQTRSQ